MTGLILAVLVLASAVLGLIAGIKVGRSQIVSQHQKLQAHIDAAATIFDKITTQNDLDDLDVLSSSSSDAITRWRRQLPKEK